MKNLIFRFLFLLSREIVERVFFSLLFQEEKKVDHDRRRSDQRLLLVAEIKGELQKKISLPRKFR